MGTFFAHWTPTELLYLVGICALLVSILAIILAVYRYSVRALADQTALQRDRQQADLALKRELIQRGLPSPELERYVDLLRLADRLPAPISSPGATGPSDEGLQVKLAESIASLEEISPSEIEQTMALLVTADRDRQAAVLSLIEELTSNDINPKATLAAVRSLCRPSEGSSRIMTAPLQDFAGK